jgi:hypothetical protein
MSLLFQNSKIDVPARREWDPFRPYQWHRAYQTNEKFRRRIRVIIAHDKKKT